MPHTRQRRKPSSIYSVNKLDNGSFSLNHFQATPAPLVATPPTPTILTPPTPTASSSTMPFSTLFPVFRIYSYTSVPRPTPRNIYTHRPTLAEKERERRILEAREARQQKYAPPAPKPKSTQPRTRRSNANTQNAVESGSASAPASNAPLVVHTKPTQSKRAGGRKKNAGGKAKPSATIVSTPKEDAAELPIVEEDVGVVAPTPSKRAPRKKVKVTTPSSRSTRGRARAKTAVLGSEEVDVDMEDTGDNADADVEMADVEETPTAKKSAKDKEKGKADPNVTPAESEGGDTIDTSSGGSPSVSPVLVPSTDLPSNPKRNSVLVDATASVKKELLIDIPTSNISITPPTPSPVPSDAASTVTTNSNATTGSKKRKRGSCDETKKVNYDAVRSGSAELMDMGKTRSGRTIKKRKMD